jgi:hypothetical protein
MKGATVVALTKLFLWNDATRLQTWPKLLAQIEPSEEFNSMTDLVKKHVSSRIIDAKHPVHLDIARSLGGIEMQAGRILLRGVGLLEKGATAYSLSAEGVKLVNLYRSDASGDAWIKHLGSVIVTREPRLRAVLRLLSRDGATLVFSGGDWYQGSLDQHHVFVPGEEPLFIFRDRPGDQYLRDWLNHEAWWALGWWRHHPLLADHSSASFVGQKKVEFSLHGIGSHLRPAFEVLTYLGVVRRHGSEAWIDHDTAIKTFGPEVAGDFGWVATEAAQEQSPSELLGSELDRLRLDTGFVIASELRDSLHQRGIENPDKLVADLLKDGLAVLEGQDYGQARHGRGLFGDPSKQLIRLRINFSRPSSAT